MNTLEHLIEIVGKEWELISAAWRTFILLTVIVFGAVSLLMRWAYGTVLSHRDAQIRALEDRVKLRDDQLSGRFSNTPPEEAQRMIEALQAQVAGLAPRRLTEAQRRAISETARPPSGTEWAIIIRWEALAFGAEVYAQDFISEFSALGWKVYGQRQMGGAVPPGTTLRVGDPNNLSPQERAVRSALDRAGITYRTGDRGSPAKDTPGLSIGQPDAGMWRSS